MYGKAFASMWVGSMMGAGAEVFALWSYCLACKTRDGFIELNPKFLSAVIGCSEEKIISAIEYLSAPDPESRTKECKGRRIVHEGAFLYRIVNAEAYTRIQKEEHLREYYREQKRKQRERENSPENNRECPKTIGHVDIDADVDTDSDALDTNVCVSSAKPKHTHTKRFTPPTVDEVRAYMLERGTTSDPERFVDFYESKGWMVGKNKMKDWKAAVRNWERNAGQKGKPMRGNDTPPGKYDDIMAMKPRGQTDETSD